MKKQKEIKNAYINEGINTLVYSIEVKKIVPNPSQPRTSFDISAISKLADSIRRYGLLQPLSVRKCECDSDIYELVAGERRLKACKMLGMESVPCIIINATPESSAELAIIENIIRQDLNMFEQGRAFSLLSSRYGMTQEEVAFKMSLSQSAVANKLRLLRLSEDEQRIILSSELTERHARALLRIVHPPLRKKALDYIICNKLNVSESERYISELISSPQKAATTKSDEKFTSERICSSIYKFISKIQRSCDKNLIVNRRSDDKCVVITLTVKKNA